ncbi:MAG: hypothetical protein O7H41_11725 [Planctomycetota bacterium]|nr:hypothetical protein [Planctomycetota bacterium]
MGPILLALQLILATSLLHPVYTSEEDKAAKKDIEATVTDRQGVSTTIKDPRCITQTKSMFGASEKVERFIVVHHGEATIKIQFETVKSLSVSKVEGDSIHIKLEFWDEEPAEFKMNSGTLLRGDSKYGEYELVVSEIKKVSFEKKKARSGG